MSEWTQEKYDALKEACNSETQMVFAVHVKEALDEIDRLKAENERLDKLAEELDDRLLEIEAQLP